jgi:hypothetical protein
VPLGVASGIHEGRQFQRERFLSRAAAKIVVHGTDNIGLPPEYSVLQKFQRRYPAGIVRDRAARRVPLPVK